MAGLSNRGKHSHSTDPARLTRAAEWQSDSSACSAIGRSLINVSSSGHWSASSVLINRAVPRANAG